MQNASMTASTGRVEYIRFNMRPEEEPHFLEGYQRAKARLQECEDCTRYELSRAETKGQLMLRIEWCAAAAEWPRSEMSVATRQFLLSLKGALKSVSEVGAYELIDAGAPQPGA